jgi:uncharacterized protein YqeY
MLVETIKHRLKDAMKNHRTVEKEILRVALGEIQTVEARGGAELPEGDIEKILRKLIKSNRETEAASEDAGQRATLAEETAILESLLPKTLTVDEIVAALESVTDAIVAAKADGPAMGVAMKTLKQAGATVDGKTVTEAVRRIRGA